MGMLEEKKNELLFVVQGMKKDRDGKVSEMEIKYRIPKNCRWNIDAREKKIVFFDADGKPSDEPVISETPE